jgi:Sec-independent protein translocase protein TatA
LTQESIVLIKDQPMDVLLIVIIALLLFGGGGGVYWGMGAGWGIGPIGLLLLVVVLVLLLNGRRGRL